MKNKLFNFLIVFVLLLTHIGCEKAVEDMIPQISAKEISKSNLKNYASKIVFANVKIDHANNSLIAYFIDNDSKLQTISETSIESFLETDFTVGGMVFFQLADLLDKATFIADLDHEEVWHYLVKSSAWNSLPELHSGDQSARFSYIKLWYGPLPGSTKDCSCSGTTSQVNFRDYTIIVQNIFQAKGQVETDDKTINDDVVNWIESFESKYAILN